MFSTVALVVGAGFPVAFAAVPLPNLLVNASFETPAAPAWNVNIAGGATGRYYQDNTTHANGAWSEAIQVWNPTPGDPTSVSLSQYGISLAANQSVTLSFWARASTPRSIQAGIGPSVSPSGWYNNGGPWSLDSTWRLYTFTSTMPATNTNAAVFFDIGDISSDVWIDGVSVTVAPLLANGSFEIGLSPWTLDQSGGAAASYFSDTTHVVGGSWSVGITVTTPAPARTGVALSQYNLPVSAGQIVSVSFYAKASAPRTLDAGIAQAVPVNQWYGPSPLSFGLTTAWTPYTFTFQLSASDPAAALHFDMGDVAGTVWIDNVTMTIGPPGVSLGDIPDFSSGNTLYDSSLTRLTHDRNEISRNFAFMVGYSGWQNQGVYAPFSATQSTMDALYNAGYGIVFTWEAEDASNEGNIDSKFSYNAILMGNHDTYIKQWAADAANWQHVFYLRLFHEMNGTWYNWGLSVNNNSASLEIQAWRYIWQIFQDQGATNVKFVWCPTVKLPVWGGDTTALADFYPGDAYVDWLGLDGYNGYNTWSLPWYGSVDVFQTTYNEMVTYASNVKPIMIAETASVPDSNDSNHKPGWITDLQNTTPFYFPNMQAVAYYNTTTWNAQSMLYQYWPYDNDSGSLSAFQTMAANQYWQGPPL